MEAPKSHDLVTLLSSQSNAFTGHFSFKHKSSSLIVALLYRQCRIDKLIELTVAD